MSDQSRYLDVIKTLQADGRDVAIVLRNLGTSGELEPFESRLAQILAARVENPEVFEKVAPYLVPDEKDPMKKLIPTTHLATARPSSSWDLKPISLDLMSPRVRQLVEKYSKAFNEIEVAARKMEKSSLSAREGNVEVYQQLKQDFGKQILAIKNNYNISYADINTLVSAAGPRDRTLPPLDAKFLLAWEEAMLRPLPWEMRRLFAEIVIKFEDPSSVSSLGELLRQAVDADQQDIILLILDALMKPAPTKMRCLELSKTVDTAKGAKKSMTQHFIGGRIERLKPWQDFLKQLEAEPDWKPHIDRLRVAAKAYKEANEKAVNEIEKLKSEPPPPEK
jgi:hypothetical protein